MQDLIPLFKELFVCSGVLTFKGSESLEPALFGGAGGTLLEFGVEEAAGEDLGFDEVEEEVVEHIIPLPCL